jgi:hypothetical protein
MDLRPFASRQDLVRQQYRDFVGREATTAEVAAGVDALSTGAVSPSQFVESMEHRPEWEGRRGPVVRIYLAVLGRPPDTAGLHYWASQLAAGASQQRVVDRMVATSEFQATFGGLSDDDFVARAYELILGRPAHTSEVDFWAGQLEHGRTRAWLVRFFAESSENRRLRQPSVDVILATDGLLGRVPTSAELSAGLARLDAGEPLAGPISDILHSHEYAARVV